MKIEKLETTLSAVGITDKYTLNTWLVQNPQGRNVAKTNRKLYLITYVRLGKVPTMTTEAKFCFLTVILLQYL